ncbi:excisionase family DNA-binding protein [Roseicyclus sp.]|uniref:excisionase family DNA-binding protein n=1 Tax=Roseicyclus sp. TaxID=1914329 RepID=UPI003F9FEDE4
MLAERWSCSAEAVRQMIHRGELRAFRVGRMFRIPFDAVEEKECGSRSDAFAEDSASTGPTPAPALDAGFSFRHAPERKPRQKPGTST